MNVLDIIQAAGAIINQVSVWASRGIVSPMKTSADAPGWAISSHHWQQCRACRAIFYVCSSCVGGQRYCRQECRARLVGNSYVQPTAATSAAPMEEKLTRGANDVIGCAVYVPALGSEEHTSELQSL